MQEARGDEPSLNQRSTLNEYVPFTRCVSTDTTFQLTV
jgi:hypothetical protein